MAPAELTSTDTSDGLPPAATVETKATLTLPGGWCCGFAHRRAEEPDGRCDVETVFVTRGGLRMTFRRESACRAESPRAAAPSRSFAAAGVSDSMPAPRRGSRVDLLV